MKMHKPLYVIIAIAAIAGVCSAFETVPIFDPKPGAPDYGFQLYLRYLIIVLLIPFAIAGEKRLRPFIQNDNPFVKVMLEAGLPFPTILVSLMLSVYGFSRFVALIVVKGRLDDFSFLLGIAGAGLAIYFTRKNRKSDGDSCFIID
jgi:hypothetical protein